MEIRRDFGSFALLTFSLPMEGKSIFGLPSDGRVPRQYSFCGLTTLDLGKSTRKNWLVGVRAQKLKNLYVI